MGAGQNNEQTRGQMGRGVGGSVSGEIISADDNSITVKTADGGGKIGVISEKTQINKASEAAKEDLAVGETVAVFGQENQDGTVTAENIQLNPTEQFSRTGNP